jgi:hypothetical protein
MDFNFEQVHGFQGPMVVGKVVPMPYTTDRQTLPYPIPNEKDRTRPYDFVEKIRALEERVNRLEEKLNAKQQ